jgi:hypothetical protein
MNTVRLLNTDLRWYRDKYLGAIFVVCLLVGISLLWAVPLPRQDLMRGARFLGIALMCLLISPQRLMILSAGLAFISLRGFVGLVLYHSAGALVVGLIAGALLYLLVVKKEQLLVPAYEIKDYSYAELAIDCTVLFTLLWAYARFIR